MASWSVVGMLSTEIAFVFILSTLVLFFYKEKYFQALLGFFFLIILSDNTQTLWTFAKVIKPFYLLLLGLLTLINRKKLISEYQIIKRYLPFLFVTILCVFFAIDPFISIQKIISYALILIVVPNIVLYEYKRIGEEFFSNLVAFSVIIHFISIAVLITFPEVGISHGDRWQGMFGNPNGLGLFLVMWYILYRVILFEFPTIFTRRERIFYLTLTFMFLWMCGSRTSMFAIAVFEVTVFGFRYSRYVSVLLIATVFIFFNDAYNYLIKVLIDLGLTEEFRLDTLEDGSGRYVAWSFTWSHIQRDAFFLGKGLGYDEYLMRSNYQLLSRLGHEGGVHNTFLILWVNTGLIGLLTFIFGFTSFFVQTFKNCIYSFPALLSFVVMAYYEPWLSSSLNPYTVIFLVFLTIMIYINPIKSHEEEII